MAVIIPDVYKGKLTKGRQYPLHYSDLEAVFRGSPVDPVYLNVWFREHQAYWKEERDRLAGEGKHRLLAAEYRPEARPLVFSLHTPWEGIENPTIVSIRIYAVPHAALIESHLTRERLCEILAGEIKRIGRRILFANRWQVRLDLLLDECVIEGVTETWTGLRAEPERRFRVGLMEPAGPPA